MFYYFDNGPTADSGLFLSRFFSARLQGFLSLLVFLDQLLDRRRVRTFGGVCESIIRLRSRFTGLYLSELGSYLRLKPRLAPSGFPTCSEVLSGVIND